MHPSDSTCGIHWGSICGRIRVIAGALATIVAIGSAAIAYAQDDWEVIHRSSSAEQSVAATPTTARPARGNDGKATSVCGEMAQPAAPAVQTIVSRINELWGTDFPVYQTVALEQPHAAPGGCIFYNATAMGMLMATRLDVNDSDMIAPMLWAIFAHEAGHEYHHDSDPSRAGVPNEIKELEADRFAGYTLQKLKIRATDLTPYWTMTGDEYGAGGGGGAGKHGSSAQRVGAFKEGWHLAEWNRPEDSESVQDALNEPVAPDNPDSAPK